MSQQPSQSVDLWAEILGKLAANWLSATNSVFSIVRTQIPNIFDGTDLKKLNSFFFQFSYKSSIVQYRYCEGQLCNNLSNENHTKLAQDQIGSKKVENIPRLASELNTIHGRIVLKLQIIQFY